MIRNEIERCDYCKPDAADLLRWSLYRVVSAEQMTATRPNGCCMQTEASNEVDRWMNTPFKTTLAKYVRRPLWTKQNTGYAATRPTHGPGPDLTMWTPQCSKTPW